MTSIPAQITFRGIDHSDAVEEDVRDRLTWLQQFNHDVTRCRVVIEVPHRHRQTGRQVHVRLELVVPGRDPIVVSHEPSTYGGTRDADDDAVRKTADGGHDRRYAHVAVREAFDVARRRLEEAVSEN